MVRRPVRQSDCLPDFFVVGPPRTGTTWLHDAMAAHVNLPRAVKETRFFDLRFSKGIEWYRRHFEPVVHGLPIGEIGATYFYSTKARERIATLIPHAKIICTVRDPVKRLYSLYRLRCSTGTIRCSFREAVQRDPELIESSRYLFHLKGWLELFGRERVLVLLYERLASDAQGLIHDICGFIGIAPFRIAQPLNRPTNASDVLSTPRLGLLTHFAARTANSLKANRYQRTMTTVRSLQIPKLFFSSNQFEPPALDPEFEIELRERMRPEVEALEELLGVDFSMWKI